MNGKALKEVVSDFKVIQPLVFVIGDFKEPEPIKAEEPEIGLLEGIRLLIQQKVRKLYGKT